MFINDYLIVGFVLQKKRVEGDYIREPVFLMYVVWRRTGSALVRCSFDSRFLLRRFPRETHNVPVTKDLT